MRAVAAAAAAPAIVPGTAKHAKSMNDKKSWRRNAVMNALMPQSADTIGTFPRREEERFEEEGKDGDQLFGTAITAFKSWGFGDNYCQQRVLRHTAEDRPGERQ